MRIEELMTESPKRCQPCGALRKAAQIISDHDCGCLPAIAGDESQTVVGMIAKAEVGEVLAMICQPRVVSGLAPED